MSNSHTSHECVRRKDDNESATMQTIKRFFDVDVWAEFKSCVENYSKYVDSAGNNAINEEDFTTEIINYIELILGNSIENIHNSKDHWIVTFMLEMVIAVIEQGESNKRLRNEIKAKCYEIIEKVYYICTGELR